jgi:fatty-acyl-CoA synthase
MPAHFAHWPPGLPRHLTVPRTNLYYNVEFGDALPGKPFIVFYDTTILFAEFQQQAERIAGYLQQDCGLRAGDRVLLYMQNSPHWVLSYYGILRANAVVVPVNPMNKIDELRHYVADSGASTAIVAQDLLPQLQPLLGRSRPTGPGCGMRSSSPTATTSDRRPIYRSRRSSPLRARRSQATVSSRGPTCSQRRAVRDH